MGPGERSYPFLQGCSVSSFEILCLVVPGALAAPHPEIAILTENQKIRTLLKQGKKVLIQPFLRPTGYESDPHAITLSRFQTREQFLINCRINRVILPGQCTINVNQVSRHD